MTSAEHERRMQSLAKLGQVQVCLASAGTLLLGARGATPEADALVTALRDSITDLMKDVETVRSVLHDR